MATPARSPRQTKTAPVRRQPLAFHVASLCAAHEITHVVDEKRTHAIAEPKTRRITTPRPVTRIRSYYIALHEIAHVILGFDERRTRAPQEAAAWAWALDEAIRPPSEGVRRMILKVLWGYLVSDGYRHARGYRREGCMIPAREDAFWSFLAEQLNGNAAEALYQAAKITSVRIDPLLVE
jgi:hypothetical protein